MSLKEDLNRIGENLQSVLDSLQTEFEKFEADQHADSEAFIQQQSKDLAEKRDDLSKRDVEAREKAEEATQKTIEAFDKELEKARKAEAEALSKKISGAVPGKQAQRSAK